jgi:hypothetical protein
VCPVDRKAKIEISGPDRQVAGFGAVGVNKDGNANDHKWPQINANSAGRLGIAVRGSQVQHDALKLQARRPEIEQQAQVSSGRSAVADASRIMRAVERPHGFQFDQNRVRRGRPYAAPRPARFQKTFSRNAPPGVFATVKARRMLWFDIASGSALFAFICVAFAFIRVHSSFPTPSGWDGLAQERW